MRVSAYEELWRILHYLSYYASVVAARIAAYMLHKHVDILAFETQHIVIHQS